MTGTDLDCFNFGVNRFTNFAPISIDLLFVGSVDSVGDQYYLTNYNFSDTPSFVWKKSISCPTTGCIERVSDAILSRDKSSIYTMILYDSHFLFYKVNVNNGVPESSGFVWADTGYRNSYVMREFNDFIAIQIQSSTLTNLKRLILIDINCTNVLKEYKSINSLSYAIGRLTRNGKELMNTNTLLGHEELIYHGGGYSGLTNFFFARTPINNIDQLAEFEIDTPLFTQITTTYQISSTTSNPSVTSTPRTLLITTPSSITVNAITSSVNPSFTIYVALWNEDHIQTVQSDSLVQVNFTWA